MGIFVPSPHSVHHISHRLHRIPGVIGTAGGTLEEPVISLDFRHLLLRVEFDKLGILVGGEDEEVLACGWVSPACVILLT